MRPRWFVIVHDAQGTEIHRDGYRFKFRAEQERDRLNTAGKVSAVHMRRLIELYGEQAPEALYTAEVVRA